MSSVDDPEKHFLGNLLEDDPGSPAVSSSVTPSFSRSNDTILPQLANVGPVMRPVSDPLESSAWPEPPPPYSPRLDWGLSNANTTLTSSTTPGNSWYPFMDRKETSSSELLGSFNLGGCSSTAAVPPPTLSCAPLPPSPQIHHFHHNLHHHTHTHNVVQNHYFGSPPPGLEAYGPRPTPSTPPTPPRNIVSNNVPLYESVTPNWSYTGIANINANSNSKLFSDWKKENMSSQTSPEPTIISNSTTSLGSSELEEPEKVLVHLPLTSSEVVERAKEKKNVSKSYADHLSKSKKETAIGAEKKHKQELAKKMSSQTLGENKANHVQVKEQPHSAPVVSKMPFSYRDVAARVEHSHNSGHAIHHHEEMASHHHEKKDKARTGDKSSDTKAVHTKTNDIHHDSSKEANEKKSEGSRKSRSDNEFQKINSRKNKKEKNSTVVAAPLIYESVHPVDASSRYDVLKNLESVPVQRNGKKAANGRPPLIQEVFSRSSSPAISDMCDTEEEDPQRTRSASNHIHQNGSNQMKKEQKKRVLQANQRRQKEQKKESNWIDKGFEDIKMFLQMLLQLVYEGFKWTIELVVDFCSKIYDVMHHSLEGLYAGAGKGIRRFFMFLINLLFYTVFLFRTCIYVISTFIIINLLGIVDDDEDRQEMNWGCKREIPIPTNATEYADRLSRETIRDAYSVFGLKSDCSNDEIKRNYKRLAALVSPEKCSIEAVDEVFFLVNVAFEAIGTQDARKDYTAENSRDSQIHEKVLSAWKEMSIRVEEARNTIYCDCTKRHFRIATVIPPSQARSCKRCEIKHPAKQNDIWVEKRHFGLSTVYLTCTDNVVYDITEWATCESQHAMLKNMRAHTHHVQYRLLSPMSNDYDAPSPSSSSQYFNSSMNYPSTSSTDARFLSDLQEEYSSLLRQRSLAQISFKTCEPREEDRSRRAANRRQKRWR